MRCWDCQGATDKTHYTTRIGGSHPSVTLPKLLQQTWGLWHVGWKWLLPHNQLFVWQDSLLKVHILGRPPAHTLAVQTHITLGIPPQWVGPCSIGQYCHKVVHFSNEWRFMMLHFWKSRFWTCTSHQIRNLVWQEIKFCGTFSTPYRSKLCKPHWQKCLCLLPVKELLIWPHWSLNFFTTGVS